VEVGGRQRHKAAGGSCRSLDRGGSTVGSTLRSCTQGPGFEPGLFHDAHDVPVLCQMAFLNEAKTFFFGAGRRQGQKEAGGRSRQWQEAIACSD
jgi:hypothetical protein